MGGGFGPAPVPTSAHSRVERQDSVLVVARPYSYQSVLPQMVEAARLADMRLWTWLKRTFDWLGYAATIHWLWGLVGAFVTGGIGAWLSYAWRLPWPLFFIVVLGAITLGLIGTNEIAVKIDTHRKERPAPPSKGIPDKSVGGPQFSLGSINEDVFWNTFRLPVINSGDDLMEPPDAKIISVKDSSGKPISVFPSQFTLWWINQQSVPRKPITPGDKDIVDLVYRREDGSFTFACDIQTALGNIGSIPIPIATAEIFFCVRLTAAHAQPKDQWFSICTDSNAALKARVVPTAGI